MEKEEMVKTHTLETGELRKKNNFLENQLQKMETLIESNNITQAGGAGGAYTDEYGFEDMEMNNFWGGSTFATADPFDMPPEVKSAVVKKPEAAKAQESDDKPAASGLLLILLLCGAFVASSSSSQNGSLPPLPQPIRTASAGILQTLFQDAGVSSTHGRVQDLEALTDSWTDSKSSVPNMIGLESSVAMLNAQLAGSSLEQDHQQFMQLSAAEYNDVTSKEFLRDPEPTSTRGRRSLEEGLASMRSHSKPSHAAEVYTRSLLWDKVDAEVVRRFAAFAQRAASGQAASGEGSNSML